MRKMNIGMISGVIASLIAATMLLASGARAQEAQRPEGQAPQQAGGLVASGSADFDPNQPIKPGFQLSIL